MVYAMDDFAQGLTAAMTARGIGVRALARRVHCDPALSPPRRREAEPLPEDRQPPR